MKSLELANTDFEARLWKAFPDYTSVWTPDHFNPLCCGAGPAGKMTDHEKNSSQCACGSSLPEPPAYFSGLEA
jgi:hypothetical protein